MWRSVITVAHHYGGVRVHTATTVCVVLRTDDYCFADGFVFWVHYLPRVMYGRRSRTKSILQYQIIISGYYCYHRHIGIYTVVLVYPTKEEGKTCMFSCPLYTTPNSKLHADTIGTGHSINIWDIQIASYTNSHSCLTPFYMYIYSLAQRCKYHPIEIVGCWEIIWCRSGITYIKYM